MHTHESYVFTDGHEFSLVSVHVVMMITACAVHVHLYEGRRDADHKNSIYTYIMCIQSNDICAEICLHLYV